MDEADIQALREFKALYPTWWWKIGWCDATRDFDCAPQGHSPEAALIRVPGDCWDGGFSCDHTGSIADAICAVMEEITKQSRRREDENTD